MEINAFIEILKNLGLTPLNIVLLGMVYLLMAHIGIVDKFWLSGEEKKKQKEYKRNYDDGRPIMSIPDLADGFGRLEQAVGRLSQYYNHDTTQHQQTVINALGDIKDGLRDIRDETKEQGKLVRASHTITKELKEYGVKCRKDV